MILVHRKGLLLFWINNVIFVSSQKGTAPLAEESAEEDEDDIDIDFDDEDFEGLSLSLSLSMIDTLFLKNKYLSCLVSSFIMVNIPFFCAWQMMKMICLSIIWLKNLIHPHILPRELVKLHMQYYQAVFYRLPCWLWGSFHPSRTE